MKTLNGLVVASVICLTPVLCFGQATAEVRQSGPLSLVDFEQMAMRNNPSLTIAWSHVEATRGRLIQAGLFPNTIIGYHATEIGNLGRAGQQGGFVSQRFITAGKRRLDKAVAGQEMQQAEFQFQAQQCRVLNDVRTRFYDVLVAQHKVGLAGKLAHVGEESVRASKQLVESLQSTRNNLLQAEIESESARILYDNAVNEHLESWRRLSAVVAVPNLRLAPVVGDLDRGVASFTWDDSLAAVLTKSPELAAAHAKVERAQFTVNRERRERIPNVDALLSVRHQNITSDDVANVQIGIPIPLLDRNQGNIYRAEAELAAARAEVRQIELDLQDRLAVSYRRYANAQQQADKYSKRILPRANESLTLVQNGYEKGQVAYLTLLTTQRTYFRVHLDYLAAIRELRQSAVQLDGQLLSGSLQTRW